MKTRSKDRLQTAAAAKQETSKPEQAKPAPKKQEQTKTTPAAKEPPKITMVATQELIRPVSSPTKQEVSKVFLQKRPNGEVADSVVCSICGENLSSARDLGLHILAKHCDSNVQEKPAEPGLNNNITTNIVITPPTESSKAMTVTTPTQTNKTMIITPLTQATKTMTITTMPTFTNLAPTITNQTQTFTSRPQTLTTLTPSQPRTTTIVKKIVTPRNPTEDEKSSRVMIYKASNGVFKYICLICGIVTTEKLQIKSHMDNHTQAQRTAPEIVNKKIILVSSTAAGINRPFGTVAAVPISQFQIVRSQPSIVIAPNVSITPIKKPSIQSIPITPMVQLQSDSVNSYGPAEIHLKTEQDEIEDMEVDPLAFDSPQELSTPRIVSVQSVASFITNNNNTESDSDFENMGYRGEIDDDFSEELMIEPDISLDYDDIEDTSAEEAENGTSSRNFIQNSLMCSFCSSHFDNQEALLDHLRVHIDIPHRPVQAELEKGYMTLYTSSRVKHVCLLCGKFFPTMDSVKTHIKNHVKDDSYYFCYSCEKVFPHRTNLTLHNRKQHGIQNELECVKCNTEFPNFLSLSNHTRTCTAQPKKKSKANRPPPKLIQLSTDTPNNNNTLGTTASTETGDHILVRKVAPITTSAPLIIKTVNQPNTVLDSRTFISIAPKPTVSLLSEEAKKILSDSLPPSSQNGDSTNPRAHKIIETPAGREYIPDTNSNNIVNLDTIYPQPNAYENKRGFMLRPVGTGGHQRFVCVDCGKHYTTSYNVRMHRNIHLGKNLYSCKFCLKEFSHKHVWETHERVHTGERPFKCPTCPKDFADRSNYNSHKKICLRLQNQQNQPQTTYEIV